MPTKVIFKKKPAGSIILSVLFVVFVAFVGLGILGHTITHIRILGCRTRKTAETAAIAGETIRHLHGYREKVFSEQRHECFSPDKTYFNSENFPDTIVEGTLFKNNFNFREVSNPLFKKIRIVNTVDARSTRSNRMLKSCASLDVLSGKIPLNLIPLFLRKKIEISEEKYLKANRIDIINAPNPVVGDFLVDFNISDFLIHSLKISGSILGWPELREKFGLEISEEPIAEGIYLVAEDHTVESVFIQGDLRQLIFSAEDDRQKIEFHLRDRVVELGYGPKGEDFFCWDPEIGNDFRFNEKIIVNGNVWSLEQKNGYPAFREDSGILLMVSGQTVIRTALETRNLEMKKLRLNNLTLVCSHHALFDPPETPARVVVENGEKIPVQATIMVNGIFENRSPELELSGSLFARDILNQGHIKLNFTESSRNPGEYFHTIDFLFISDFFVDFIEEVTDV
jgi:hypothetical protein